MAVKFRDYYEALGVPRNADQDQIKQAYRRLARKLHPEDVKIQKALVAWLDDFVPFR